MFRLGPLVPRAEAAVEVGTGTGLHPRCFPLCPDSLKAFHEHRCFDIWISNVGSGQKGGSHALPHLHGTPTALIPNDLPTSANQTPNPQVNGYMGLDISQFPHQKHPHLGLRPTPQRKIGWIPLFSCINVSFYKIRMGIFFFFTSYA